MYIAPSVFGPTPPLRSLGDLARPASSSRRAHSCRLESKCPSTMSDSGAEHKTFQASEQSPTTIPLTMS